MTKIAVAVIQTPWDCKWSRPGYRLTGVIKRQPEPLWVCVRTSHRRPLQEGDCDECPHWERDEDQLH